MSLDSDKEENELSEDEVSMPPLHSRLFLQDLLHGSFQKYLGL